LFNCISAAVPAQDRFLGLASSDLHAPTTTRPDSCESAA
jgi:hypothetical protein